MCGTEEWEKKENMYGFYEKQDAYCTKTWNINCENVKNDESIEYFVDIRRSAYYDTDMEQVPQDKVTKRKQCECGTNSGW